MQRIIRKTHSAEQNLNGISSVKQQNTVWEIKNQTIHYLPEILDNKKRTCQKAETASRKGKCEFVMCRTVWTLTSHLHSLPFRSARKKHRPKPPSATPAEVQLQGKAHVLDE